jgi:hypothetical protein
MAGLVAMASSGYSLDMVLCNGLGWLLGGVIYLYRWIKLHFTQAEQQQHYIYS